MAKTTVGRTGFYTNPGKLQALIEEYFATDGKKTISGLAYHLGFESRQSFYDYEKREDFAYIIKRARLRIEKNYEEKLQDQNCTGAIFALKNMGWKDKTETELSGGLVVQQITGMEVLVVPEIKDPKP